jgi:hypothetical protein
MPGKPGSAGATWNPESSAGTDRHTFQMPVFIGLTEKDEYPAQEISVSDRSR